ncbi:MAG TPA: hypothetical protein VGH49_19060, partial [Xanthobacteraceae bacterium]
NAKSKIVLASILFSAIASPSFAGDQDLAALQVSSGRILGQQFSMPTDVYASAVRSPHRNFVASQRWTTEMSANDRLAQGHN